MGKTGTHEAKRLRRAVPPTTRRRTPGCLVALAAWLLGLFVAYWFTREPVAIALALPVLVGIVVAVVRYTYGLVLLVAVRSRWTSQGLRCLLVYSNSPAWESHVRSTWLPRFGHVAVILNWSERASWRGTLAVRVFRRFCGQTYNLNPSVVVFRGLRAPLVFRFFYSFREVKAGRDEYLRRLEAELFEELGVGGTDLNTTVGEPT